MGCGEPLCNLRGVINSCTAILKRYSKKCGVVRFAVASLIPNLNLMRKFIESVKENNLRMKFHLSLHAPEDKSCKDIMPSAQDILESISLVESFMRQTGNSAEIHYALIDGVNDSEDDLNKLVKIVRGRIIPVKFLAYNQKPSLDLRPSEKIRISRDELQRNGVITEYYYPPGWDIGSSCGQFLMDYYEKYNSK